MKVKDLIIQLLELSMNSEIGIASYDEDEELWGDALIILYGKKETNIQHGDINLDYYLR